VSVPRYLDAQGQPSRAYLVAGEDPSLVRQQLNALLAELVGLESGPGALEEYGEGSGAEDESALGPLLDACRTLPFFTDRRIVVWRTSAALDAAAQRELTAYLDEPLESTVLVLALIGRRAPAALTKAVTAKGTVLSSQPASGARARQEWLGAHIADAGLRLDGAATNLLDHHLGGDLGRLEQLLATLVATYGPHARLGVEEIEPLLGSAGEAMPWDLTDALSTGDTAGALDALSRQLAAGRHGLQILSSLHRHYGALLRLDGAEITDERGAAAATGLSPYPARKALEQSRRLGHERVTRAIGLLAGADLDLRGRVAWPPELVLEVLVARLAQLSRLRTGARAAAPTRARVDGRSVRAHER
jgi:DNA polymerase-3 subunit delta